MTKASSSSSVRNPCDPSLGSGQLSLCPARDETRPDVSSCQDELHLLAPHPQRRGRHTKLLCESLQRCLLLAALLAVSFATPGFAQQSGTLSFSLSNPPTSAPPTKTSFDATLGGVKGTITMNTDGTWTMNVAGQTFASGTYTCGGGSCSFNGTTLSGKNLSFSLTNKTGTLTGLFPNHGAWVSTVAGWANGHLSGRNRGDVVSQAAGGKGHDPSNDPSHGSAQSASGLDHGGNSAEHGGGGGHGK
jgi:hypothetical protein